MNLPHLLVVFSLNVFVAIEVDSQVCNITCPPENSLGLGLDSICEDDTIEEIDSAKEFKSCFGDMSSFKLSDFKGDQRVVVISNYYYGSNAAQKESGVFAHTAQKLRDKFGNQVVFISSNKGADCRTWADEMATDALDYYPDSAEPDSMPLVMHDTDSILRDLLFTPPFPEPSYVILDGDLKVRHKFTGPCCGLKNGACKIKRTKKLDERITRVVTKILEENPRDITSNNTTDMSAYTNTSFENKIPREEPTSTNTIDLSGLTTPVTECTVGKWSDWSECSLTCGSEGSGIEFRWRIVKDTRDPKYATEPCPSYVETVPCDPESPVCNSTCAAEIGSEYEVKVIAEGFDSPRDVAFHPEPGYHLGTFSEGRKYSTENLGDGEAWVVNGHNHSVSIVSAVRSEEQTTTSRRDRAYYHNMANATAISFNSVGNSGRAEQRDSYMFWGVCNDNLNTYLDTKAANYFMGPSLYNSGPNDDNNTNTVNRLGEPCKKYDQCNFAHSDMLHESPACIGIAHDPEVNTAFGNVYWAFDSTGNQQNGQLVRFDFQQPHRPGSKDHSIASVRRYPEVKLHRGGEGIHAGMVVHPTRREIFIANPGNGTIIVVNADSGFYARNARKEYPIFSNRQPTFVYSIWECVEQRVFASNLTMPSGMALSMDGERLYVAEHDSGKILVYDVASATIMNVIQTNSTIEGMAISPNSDTLYFVDSDMNTLNAVTRNATCNETDTNVTYVSEEYAFAIAEAEEEFEENKLGDFSVYSHNCTVDTDIPDKSYFDEPDDSGFASTDPNVQGPVEDENAYLLENKKCGKINFDQLLLGGFYCHTCLPNSGMCEDGGTCQNVQWKGFICDNQFLINSNMMRLTDSNRTKIKASELILDPDITYRFDITGWSLVYLSLYAKKKIPLELPGNPTGSIRRGSYIFKPSDIEGNRHELYIRSLHKPSLKFSIVNECRDGTLLYMGDREKDCKWLGSKKKRRDRLCKDNKQKWVRRSCPKTCKVCPKD